MKLEDIKTVEQAKALAFDTLGRVEMEQQNLRALQQRIAQLEADTAKKKQYNRVNAGRRRTLVGTLTSIICFTLAQFNAGLFVWRNA